MNQPNFIKSIPNILSLTRVPLSFIYIFLPPLRCIAIVLAMISDVLDGFIARKFNLSSPNGAIIDPITDKLFVGCALITLFIENSLTVPELVCFLCRDISLLLFVMVRFFYSGWKVFKVQAFYCGKVTTALQFFILIMLSLNWNVPAILFQSMAITGFFSFIELILFRKNLVPSE